MATLDASTALQAAMASLTPDQVSAEYDQLRSLRRRSLSSPSDPDLPNSARSPPVPPSPTLTSPPTSPSEVVDLPFGHGFSRGSPATASATASSDSDTPLPLSDLMWLPAHLHPDVAPQEFRAFLAEQTKPEALMRRSGSLNRKKSMLSKQYTPIAGDGVEASSSTEELLPTEGASARRRDPLEKLTITDLQKLEQLAVQAAQEGDKGDEGKEHFQTLIRRTMSTGPAVESLDVDSQPLVQAPGGLIRRTARTKIRKSTLEGDGGGHRFGPSRRTRRDSEQSSTSAPLDHRGVERRGSVTDSDELHDEPLSATSPTHSRVLEAPIAVEPVSPTRLAAPIPRPRAPSPGPDEQRPGAPVHIESVPMSIESPPPTVIVSSHPPAPPVGPPISVAPPPVVAPPIASTSKRSGWARLVSRSPKSTTEDEDESSDTSSIASTSSKKSQKGVFSNLFRSRNREDGGGSPREIDLPAQMMISPTASGMLDKNGRYTNFYRLPIHVERAVYRLSHIKLANPRRPLLEQVLISNLMFWYLGVIHRPTDQNGATPPEPIPRQPSPEPPVAIVEPMSDLPPPLAKRPVMREAAPPRKDAAFEVLHRQTASHPSPSTTNKTDDWMNSWPRGKTSPVRENGMWDGS